MVPVPWGSSLSGDRDGHQGSKHYAPLGEGLQEQHWRQRRGLKKGPMAGKERTQLIVDSSFVVTVGFDWLGVTQRAVKQRPGPVNLSTLSSLERAACGEEFL